MTALYQLTGAYQQLLEIAEDGDDIADALAQLDDAVQAKALNICRLLATLDANAEAAGAEAKRLAARAKAFEANADKLKAYVKDCMKQSGITRIKSPQFSLALVDGQPRVEVHDLEAVPPEFVRVKTTREPDKRALLDEYKRDGVVPPGCDIVATTQLRVR
jgi:Siphovirus Gp157